jgi:hypothetical protein
MLEPASFDRDAAKHTFGSRSTIASFKDVNVVDVLMAMEAEVLMDVLLIALQRIKVLMDAPFDTRVAWIAVPRGERQRMW